MEPPLRKCLHEAEQLLRSEGELPVTCSQLR